MVTELLVFELIRRSDFAGFGVPGFRCLSRFRRANSWRVGASAA